MDPKVVLDSPRLLQPFRRRSGPCNNRTSGKPHALARKCCTEGKSQSVLASYGGASVFGPNANLNGVALERPWPQTSKTSENSQY